MEIAVNSMTIKEVRLKIAEMFAAYGLEGMAEWSGVTPRGLSAAIRRRELKTLDPEPVAAFGMGLIKEAWHSCAMAVTCEPGDYPTDDAYHAACADLATDLRKTSLFTEEEVEAMSRPMTRIG